MTKLLPLTFVAAVDDQRHRVLIGTMNQTCRFLKYVATVKGGTFNDFIAQMQEQVDQCRHTVNLLRN